MSPHSLEFYLLKFLLSVNPHHNPNSSEMLVFIGFLFKKKGNIIPFIKNLLHSLIFVSILIDLIFHFLFSFVMIHFIYLCCPISDKSELKLRQNFKLNDSFLFFVYKISMVVWSVFCCIGINLSHHPIKIGSHDGRT